ncbi:MULTISPECIES: ModD protein [Pseudanabaena]|uniref:ModD protein n=1 Tax=Pseudanabaena TaxID=1152 RepID=UPI002478C0A6|nr:MULTISPECIES: ModD protein [Pseudanabaena]MEA5488075.1 ModD protein [Pseudanabaena sp. CCNP1317]WGS75200.1 ModD protein [Pseudanabaena galeata CCNP1313]
MKNIFSDAAITQLIEEDVPYFDLTTFGLGIGKQQGAIEFYSRHPMVVCATEESARVFELCGAKVQNYVESGLKVANEELILKATGSAEALHIAWRIALNLMEYASGMASRTKSLVTAAHEIDPSVAIVCTRKAFPSTRKLSMKAILAGGAVPHRLGLSETILIFKEHLTYLGGMSELLKHLPELKHRFQESKIGMEVETEMEAWAIAEAGVDIIQFDKVACADLKTLVTDLKHKYPNIKLAAAGGINPDNIRDYASTGIDLLVTSYPYFGRPADIGVKMFNLELSSVS